MYFSTFLFCFCWMEGAWDRSAAPSVVMFTFSFTAACWKSFLDPSTQRSPNFLVISGTLAAPWPPVQSQFIPLLCNTPEMVDAGVCARLIFPAGHLGLLHFGVKWGDFWLAEGWMTSHDLGSGSYWDIHETRYLLPCCCWACQTLWSMLTIFVILLKQICTCIYLYMVLKLSCKLKCFLKWWWKEKKMI